MFLSSRCDGIVEIVNRKMQNKLDRFDLKIFSDSNYIRFFSVLERVCLTDQQNETSDLVPIIVGAALAALVLFVLIAYLVGRARAKKTTYETI